MPSQQSSYIDASNMYRTFQDANIPFPRTSGAKFSGAGKSLERNISSSNLLHGFISSQCLVYILTPNFRNAGMLVCFGRAPVAKRAPLHSEVWTPRSLSAFGGVWTPGTPTHTYTPVSSYYYQERVSSSSSSVFLLESVVCDKN